MKLCGGMAYSALDYYFNDLPIPTHRVGDFGANVTVPPEGRLHSMIYNRLIDSFADNFGKWSCVYPELDAAVGAALGLVVGGGLLGAVVGAVWGGVYGELHEVFSCPSGGPAGMTRQELPNLTGNFLDKKIPVPIGLIFDSDILNIGQSHQVVAYGYSRNGTTMTINIYDNRFHDEECTLVLNSSNPGVIKEYSVTNNNKDLGSWAGLLVSDGYQPQWPSYGPDISIASPQSLQLTGPVVTGPVSVLSATAGRECPASACRFVADVQSDPHGRAADPACPRHARRQLLCAELWRVSSPLRVFGRRNRGPRRQRLLRTRASLRRRHIHSLPELGPS